MIETRRLKKSFGPQRVLDGVDLRVEKGESVVIIGRSGGGKSILLKHLIGLLSPDEGDVLIEGESVAWMNERQLLGVRRKFGMLFQGAALFDSLTVAENVAFVLQREGRLTESEIGKKVDEALAMVDLGGTQDKKPAELSGGMRKRVGLARAIIRQPSCVLYDEPTSGLDPVVSDSINRLIRRLQHRFGMTSIVVTHDMKSAAKVGDHIAYLHEGRIYFYGTPDELTRCQDPIIQDFLQGRSEPTER